MSDLPIDPREDHELFPEWTQYAVRPEIDQAIQTIHQNMEAEITQRSPTCWQSGKCCQFDSYGHRLYVTGLETAWVIQALTPSANIEKPSTPDTPDAPKSSALFALPQTAELPKLDSCPFQIDKRCSIHTVRPMGCRVFFCQQGTQDWQQSLYETYHHQIESLHAQHDIPYRYMEWRYALSVANAQ